MKDLIVETRNVKMLGRAVDRLFSQSRMTPHFGVVAGPVGCGRSTATRSTCVMPAPSARLARARRIGRLWLRSELFVPRRDCARASFQPIARSMPATR